MEQPGTESESEVAAEVGRWFRGLSPRERGDPLWAVSSYRFARYLAHRVLVDADVLARRREHRDLAEQLVRAVHSIASNVAEGYGRPWGRDRNRYLEYALGSTRESLVWYAAAVPRLGEAVVAARSDVLVDIRRLLLATLRNARLHPRASRHAYRKRSGPAEEPGMPDPRRAAPCEDPDSDA